MYGHIYHVAVPDRPESDSVSPPASSGEQQDGHRVEDLGHSSAERKVSIVASLNASAADIVVQVCQCDCQEGSRIQAEFERFCRRARCPAGRGRPPRQSSKLAARTGRQVQEALRARNHDRSLRKLHLARTIRASAKGLSKESKTASWEWLGMPGGCVCTGWFAVKLTPMLGNTSEQKPDTTSEAEKKKHGKSSTWRWTPGGRSRRAPETLVRLAELKIEIQRQLVQNAPLVAALINGDAKDFDARIKHLSPTAQGRSTARTLLVELGHELVDHITPRDLGNIVGQVLYEVVEDAAISAWLAAAEAATVGAATPAVGAAIAQKGLKIARIVHRLEKRFGDTTRIAKALKKAEQLVFYMINYAICFVAGTPVHTATGLKNIEDVQTDDLVLSRDENAPGSQVRLRRIIRTIVTHPDRLYHIRLAAGGTREFETLSGTGEHPFYVVNRQAFVPAKELIQGDTLSLADGRTALVAEIAIEDAAAGKPFTTYNLEIADDHTYFVGKAGVWVHNVGSPCDEAFAIFLHAKLRQQRRLGRASGRYKFWRT